MSINSQSLMAARTVAWCQRVFLFAAISSISGFSAHASSPRFNHDVNGNQVSQQVVTLAAPTIITQPMDALLPPGGTVRFHVVAAGPGALRYQWRHNATNIASATNDSLEVAGLATNLTNYGLYTVVISNSAGSVTSAGATVLPDTDSDNLADALERLNFTNLTQNPWDDFDGDGVSNYDEVTYGSSPAAINYYLTNEATWFLHNLPAPSSPSSRWPQLPSGSFFAPGRTNSFYGANVVPGMTINANTGALAGDPSVTGQFAISIFAPTYQGTASQVLNYEVTEFKGWGRDVEGQISSPSGISNVIEISVGAFHSLALKGDGTVVSWGANWNEQTNVPSGLTNAVAIAAGAQHSIAITSDGTIIPWGAELDGQYEVMTTLSDAVAIAAGGNHALALRDNGTVLAWGDNSYGQTNVPTRITNAVAVAAGETHSLALLANGKVEAWGANFAGQTNVPPSLSNVVAVAAGYDHNLALLANGTVVPWGAGGGGRTNVPLGLSNVVAIAAGESHSLALRSDGTVIGWGSNGSGETALQSKILTIGAGKDFSMALVDLPPLAGTAITAPRVALGQHSLPMRVRVAAKGQGNIYGAAGLPGGLSINTSTGIISGSPTQSGTFDATVTVSGTNGTAQKALRLIVFGASTTGFQAWPVLSSLPADRRSLTHRNGPMNLPNMLSYAMALDPMNAKPGDLPNVHTILTDSVKFTFRRAKGVSDVDLTVIGSTALQGVAWTNAPVTRQVITDRGNHETVDVTIPRPSGGRYFLRLEAATP